MAREPRHGVSWWDGDHRTEDRLREGRKFETAKEAAAEVRRQVDRLEPKSSKAWIQWWESHAKSPRTQEASYQARRVGNGWVWEWQLSPAKALERKFEFHTGKVQPVPVPTAHAPLPADHPASVSPAEREQHAMLSIRDANRALARNSDFEAQRQLDNLHDSIGQMAGSTAYRSKWPELQLEQGKIEDWARKHSDNPYGSKILQRLERWGVQRRLEERFAPKVAPSPPAKRRRVVRPKGTNAFGISPNKTKLLVDDHRVIERGPLIKAPPPMRVLPQGVTGARLTVKQRAVLKRVRQSSEAGLLFRADAAFQPALARSANELVKLGELVQKGNGYVLPSAPDTPLVDLSAVARAAAVEPPRLPTGFAPATIPPRRIDDEPPLLNVRATRDLWEYSDEQLDRLFALAQKRRDKSEADRIRANARERISGPGLSRTQREMLAIVKTENDAGRWYVPKYGSTLVREQRRQQLLPVLVKRGELVHGSKGYGLAGWSPAALESARMPHAVHSPPVITSVPLEERQAKAAKLRAELPETLAKLGPSHAWVKVSDLRSAFPETSRDGLDLALLDLGDRIEHRSPTLDPVPALRLRGPLTVDDIHLDIPARVSKRPPVAADPSPVPDLSAHVGAGNAVPPGPGRSERPARKPPRRGGGAASAPHEEGQGKPSTIARAAKPPKAKTKKPRKAPKPRVKRLKRWCCTGFVRTGCGGGARVVVPRIKANIFTRI